MSISNLERCLKFKSKATYLQKYENIIIFILTLIAISILNLPVWKDYMHSEDLYALGLYSSNNNFLNTIFSPIGDVFFRPFDLIWGIFLQSMFNGNANTLRVFNLLLTGATVVLLNIILKKIRINLIARLFGIIFFILAKVHFTTIGYLSSYAVIVTTLHLELTLLFLINGIGYINSTHKINWKYYLFSLVFFFITVLSRDISFSFIIPLLVIIYLAKYKKSGQYKEIILLSTPFVAVLLICLTLRYILIGTPGFGISNNNFYYVNVNVKDIITKILIFFGNVFNLPIGYKESFGIGSIFELLTKINVKSSYIKIFEYGYLLFGITELFFVSIKNIKNKKILIFPFSLLLASMIPLFLIPTYRIYYLYPSFISISFLLASIFNQINFNKLSITIILVIITINFLNLLVHNRWSSYYILTHRWTYKVAENGINKFISQNNKNEIESLTIISSNTEVIDYVFNASPDNIFLKKVINPKVKFYVTNNTNLKLTKFSDLNPVYNFNENLSFEKVEL